jgi:prepilin-type N-terminal cleavage/methylation domain-containing protein
MSIKPQRGFTLIELLIVIAIISILVGFTVVVAGGMMARAKSTKDMANHRIIGQANWNFSTNNNGMLFSPRVMKTDFDPQVVGDAVVDSINSRLWYIVLVRELMVLVLRYQKPLSLELPLNILVLLVLINHP